MTDIVAKSETYDPASTSIVKLAKTELLGAGFSCLIKLLDLTLRYQYFHEGNRREAERDLFVADCGSKILWQVCWHIKI